MVDPGEVWTYTCAMPLFQTTTNTVTVSGLDSQGNVVDWDDTLTVAVTPPDPAIDVLKSANAYFVEPGEVVTYTYRVGSYFGNVPLHDVRILVHAGGFCIIPSTELRMQISIWIAHLQNLRLWPRMVLAVSAGFLFLFSAFALLSERALQNSADRLLNERLVIAQMTAAQIDNLLQQGIAELVQAERLADFDAEHPDLSAEANMLVHTYSRIRLFAPGVLFLDAQGNVVLAHPTDLYPVGSNLSSLPHVAVSLAQREVSISDPFQEPLKGRPVVAITVPIFKDEQFTGLLVGFFDLSAQEVLAPLVQAATLGHTGHAVLVDHRGRVLASTLPLPFLSPGEHLDFYRRALQNREATIETTPFGLANVPGETQNELHVMAFVPLRTMPWGVAVGGDLDETFVGVWRLRTGMTVLGIVALLVVGGATLVGARRLVQPLQHLTESARRIASGKLQTPLHVSAGGEIGEMATALEAMRRQLLAHITEQSRLNDTLERLVAAQGDELVRHHTVLSGLDQVIQTPLSLKAMLSQILTQTLSASQLRQGAIFLRDDPTNTLRPAVTERLEARQLDDLRALAEEAIAHRAPLQSADASSAPPLPALSIPLVLDEDVLGALVLVDDHSQTLARHQITLLSAIAGQTALLIRNDQLYARLKAQAIAEERSRLAREIHDSVVQTVGYLKLQVERMHGWLQEENLSRLKREMDDLAAVLEEVYASARDAIAGLRVGLNPGDTLESTLAEYTQSFAGRYGLPVELVVQGNPVPLPATTILHLLRIVQEGLTNIRRHARAAHAWVTLNYQSDALRMTIGDDGDGVDPASLERAGARGVVFMQERVESVGGQLSIVPRSPRGTAVRVMVPYPTSEVE